MAINIKFDELGIFGIIVGITGAVVAGIMTKKTNDISRKLGKSIDDIDKSTVVQVRQSIINKATENAVNRQVGGAISRAVNDITAKMKMDMSGKIRQDVDKEHGYIKNKVKDKILDVINKTDFDELVEEALDEVKDYAKDKAVEEIENADFDDILDEAKDRVVDYFCRLENVKKIFGNTSREKRIDMENLSKVINSVPTYERAEVLTSIFGKKD